MRQRRLKDVDPRKAFRLLEASPVLFVTTRGRDGRANIMTMSFYSMIDQDPPLIGCALGPWDFSYTAIEASGECVLAIPTVDLVKTVVDIGNCSGAEIDKFERFGLTARDAKRVRAPLIDECLANVECRVVDRSLVKKYGLFVVKAVAISLDAGRKERRTLHHNGDGTFVVDGRTLNLRKRMVLWKAFQVDL